MTYLGFTAVAVCILCMAMIFMYLSDKSQAEFIATSKIWGPCLFILLCMLAYIVTPNPDKIAKVELRDAILASYDLPYIKLQDVKNSHVYNEYTKKGCHNGEIESRVGSTYKYLKTYIHSDSSWSYHADDYVKIEIDADNFCK
jgi:hypothetical protein